MFLFETLELNRLCIYMIVSFQLNKCVQRNAISVEAAISCLKSHLFQGLRVMKMSWVVCLNNDCTCLQVK